MRNFWQGACFNLPLFFKSDFLCEALLHEVSNSIVVCVSQEMREFVFSACILLQLVRQVSTHASLLRKLPTSRQGRPPRQAGSTFFYTHSVKGQTEGCSLALV